MKIVYATEKEKRDLANYLREYNCAPVCPCELDLYQEDARGECDNECGECWAKALEAAETGSELPSTDRPGILEAAIERYGKGPQVDVAIEEMSELIRALLKERRAEKYGRCAREQREAIHGKNGVIEETADVIIMLTQLCMIFGDSDEVQQAIEEKVNRLEKTLARADKGDSGATWEASQGCIAPAT